MEGTVSIAVAADGSAASLHATEQGRGPPVVLLPGLGGTTRYWDGGLEPLRRIAHVVRIDLLGFGDSPKPWRAYTVERHVGALLAATAHLPPMTLVGHSLGAALALMLAARAPERVERLILLGLPYFGNRRAAYSYYRGPPAYAWWATNVVLVALACLFTRRVVGWLLPYVLTGIPRAVAQDLVKHTWRSSTSSLWNVLYDHDLADDVATLPPALPVVCVHGAADVMAPIAGVQRLAADRPGWRVVVLPGVDHHLWLRCPDVCVQHILPAVAVP